MKSLLAYLAMTALLITALPALGQRILPPLHDGSVLDEKTEYRHDGPLRIEGHVKLKGISLDLRGPITVAAGANFELEDVHIKVSDPPSAPNGTSGLICEGPAKVTVLHSTMAPEGSAHPMWRLQGELSVNDFQTKNSEFHLDHVHAKLENFTIFELEISHASEVVGNHLRLVFLSTHTGDNDKLEFSDIPSDKPFTQKFQMGSLATADLTDVSAELFLLYVHGSSDVALNRIGRAQLSIAPSCKGTLTLPHGMVGSPKSPVVVPEPGSSDCPFRFRLNEVNADTWDVYAQTGADLTFTKSVIDELTGNGNARVTVRDSEIFADWLSFGGDAQLQVSNSTVGAQRLATERPDLATSQVRLNGNSHAIFDHTKFDCGVMATGNSIFEIHDAVISPKYIRRSDHATVKATPPLPIEDLAVK